MCSSDKIVEILPGQWRLEGVEMSRLVCPHQETNNLLHTQSRGESLAKYGFFLLNRSNKFFYEIRVSLRVSQMK